MDSIKQKVKGLTLSSKLDVEKHYTIGKTLGTGTFSVVKKATHKESDDVFAIKIIDKRSCGDKTEMIMTEVDILKRVNHPNIICMKELFETPQKLYLVVELVTGGELFDRIVEKGSFSEKDAANLIASIIDAVHYLHKQDIVHRDLKPENLLYENDKDDARIKVADFGLSKFLPSEAMLKTACGTPGYVAPEILKCDGYEKPVDLWSIGVILYILLCGFPPFYDDNQAVLFDMIMAGQYDFPSPYWDDVSDDAKDLIKNLLQVDPTKRLTAAQALEHRWIKSASDKDLSSALTELKKFNAKRKFKMAILTTMAANRMRKVLG